MTSTVDVVTLEEAKADPEEVFDRAVNDSASVIVSRPGGESVVILSLSNWNELQRDADMAATRAERLQTEGSSLAPSRTFDELNVLLRSGLDQLDRGEGIEVVDLTAYLDELTERALVADAA